MGFGGRGAFGAAGCVWAGTAHGSTVSRGAGDACAAGGEVLKSDAIFFLSTIFARSSMVSDALSQFNVICIFEIKLFRYFCNGVLHHVLGINLIVGGFCMANVKRFMLTLLLGALAWMVPSAAQAAPNLLVETVRVRIKDAKPGSDYVVNTMDAFGNRKPVTYVIECFPVGSDRSVSWLRVDKTSLKGILTYKDFPTPNFNTYDDLKRIENGWELTLWTIPGEEGKAETKVQVWSAEDARRWTENQSVDKKLWVTTSDVHVSRIELEVEAQDPVLVGKGGTIRVKYTPENATDRRVNFSSDDGGVEVLPTNVPGVFSFRVLKNGSGRLRAVAENGRAGAPTAGTTLNVVQHHISDVKMAMLDGEQGGTGYDRLIYRNQTKDWMLHVTVTSDGPIVGLEKELAWSGKIGTSSIASGLHAPIYGKGAPHNTNKVWQPALVGRSSKAKPDGTVVTQLEYAFKADEMVDAPYLNLTLSWTDGNGATQKASYTLKIGEVKVNSFGVDPKETDLYVGSKPNGFITVTPKPDLAYYQGFSVRRKPGTGSDRVLKAEPIESPTGSGRYVFEAKEAGTATLTIAAADGEYTQDVTVNVRKVGVTAFKLRNETEGKNITGGDYVLRLKKGERVQLRIDVATELAYDRGFEIGDLPASGGNSRTLKVGDAGTLTIVALEGAWGQRGLYEVTGAEPGKNPNAPEALTLKSNADREGGAAGEKLTFSFKCAVAPNPVTSISVDKSQLEFVYDAEAPKSIRGGVDAQAVRIDVTPETAADATFKFTDIPGWLEVQDANGKRVNRDTKWHPAGDYYVKVTNPNMVSNSRQMQEAEIKVVSDSQSEVAATLRVVLKYIPVTRFVVVDEKTKLMVDRAERFTVRVEPADASNPRFKLVVKSSERGIVPVGVVAVSQGGEQINVSNKEGVPGEITVVGNQVSRAGEQFKLALKAVEQGSAGTEYVSAGFTVVSEPVQSVEYAKELVVPIRSSAFKHKYTVLPVTVTPADASRPALEFKGGKYNTANPSYVKVEGPQGERLYLFTPNRNDYKDWEEELVGVVKDDKNMKGGALKVKVVNVKPTKITVVDIEGKEITKPIELAKGVSYSYPLRILVEPDSVSLAELKWSPIPGKRFPGTWRVKQVGAERDSVNKRLILNYLVQTQDFATGESGFEISHTYGDGSAATKKQILFEQPKNVIEKITVEPAEVVFAGERATAIVTVTYSPEVVDNDMLGYTRKRIYPDWFPFPPTIGVKQVEKQDNVYKYEIKYSATAYDETTDVTFKATDGGASGMCRVVAIRSGAATGFTLSSADPKMKDDVLELTLGEEGMDVAEANLFREPSTQDAFYRLVEWELWRGGTKLELSKYLEVERKAFNSGAGSGSTWELQLRGLNKTAEGLDDAPLTLKAAMGTGVNRRTSDIQVRVSRSAKANERPIESVEFPIERLVVGLGETRTVEMEVAPADPSLKRLQWDFYSVPGKIHAPVSVVEGSGDEWKSLKITAGSIVGFTRMRVRASDMFGRQTSRMLLIEVVQSHYPIVVDVVDGEGRPLADARVQIRENGNNQPWLFSAYTGDEGRVEYDAVSKKTYVAEVSRSGYVRNRNNPATIYVGNKLVQVRWVLDRDLTKPVLYGVRFEVKGDGKALPGAVVSFAGFGDAESDAQGVAVYRDVPAGRYYATVRAEGYKPATVAVEHGMLKATTVQVSLEKEPMVTQKHSLTVVVRNKETQGLVEDAVVTVDGRAGVTTDVNGVATVANLEDGEYAVTVEGSGEPWATDPQKKFFKPQKVQVRVAGGNARLEVALESVVANEQPKPTMRTLTVVTVDGEFGVMLDGVAVRVAGGDVQETANGEARFQLADSRSKRKVTASKRGYVSQEEQVLVNEADATVRFTMAVQTYSVALTVKGKDGVVLEDAVVYLDGSRKTTTDATGVARFDNVRVGGHTLLAVAEGYVNGELGVDVSSNFEGEITLKRGFSPKPKEHTLTVTVKSGSNPLPGATVRLASGKTGETDANGKATFEVLNGTYVVEAFKTGYKKGVGTVEVRDNNANLNIAMEEDFSPYVQSSVTVSVIDKVSKKALDNAEVVITGATLAKKSGNVWEYKLVKGTYTLVVSCEGYVTQVETLTVTNANITKDIKLVRGKNPKFDLTVRVMTYDAQPLDGATVTIEGQTAKGTQANVTTFSLEPSAYSVKVSKAGYGSQTVEVVVKDKAVEQQVTLLRKFRVTFDAKGGRFTDGTKTLEKKVEEGKQVEEPAEPIRNSFDFKGWTLGGAVYDFAEPVTKDIVLEAKWGRKAGVTYYTVTLNARGGKFANGSDSLAVEVEGGAVMDEGAVEKPVKDGYKLMGWTLNGEAYDFTTPVNGNIELVAKWKELSGMMHTVTFLAYGGTPEPEKQEVQHGNTATKPAEDPAKSGFKFVGWFWKGNPYSFDAKVVDDLVLEAEYVAEQGVTVRKVTFLANGGLFGNGQARMEVAVADGTKVSRPTNSALTRKDHELVNWTLNGAVYNFETLVTTDIELVAQWKVNTIVTQHEVIFMAYGGKPEPEMQTVVDGAQVNRPADPAKNGFRFVGWNSNGSRYDFNAQVKKDLVLEAQWEANPGVTEVKVVFLANGGLFANGEKRIEVGVARGETVNPPTQGISRAYFTLEGWTLKGEVYDFTKPVTEDIELAALWKPETGITEYRVVFMAQGGRPEPPVQLVKSGDKAQRPADPAKEGFTFQGWNLRGGATYSFTEAVTQDIVLDAQWQNNTPATKKYTVVFVANGGTFADGKNRMEFKVAEGSRVEEPAKPSRGVDFTFSGWMLRGAAYDFTRTVKEDLVLEARWTPKPGLTTFTVTFMANGGAPEPLVQIVKNGEKAQKPIDVKKEGFTLTGWTKDGSTLYNFDDAVTADIVLKAMWNKNSGVTTHTVTYVANGGKFADESNRLAIEVADGKPANRPTDPVYEGFTFMGWTLKGEAYDFTKPVTADIVLVAQWKANQGVKAYRVVFMALGGTPEPPVQLVAEGKQAQQPADPAKDGFTFQEWTLEGATYSFTEAVTKDIVLRAKWNANSGVTKRTVTFMALGGAFADGSDVQKFTVKDGGTVLEPTAPVKEGYTLTGWTKDGNTKYNFANAVNADLVLYAMWEKKDPSVKEHTVVFVANGGAFADGKNRMEFKVADGAVLTQPEKPTRTDFTFDEWMLRGAAYDFAQPVRGDLVLEAKWEPNPGIETFTVTFMANGGTPEPLAQIVTKNGTAQKPIDVKKEGFTLKGWTLEGVQYNFTEPVTKNIVLKAQWEKENPSVTVRTVTYMANGGKFADGSERMEVEVANGKLANRPTDPVKVGYAFMGWKLNGAEYDFTEPVTSNIELVAQWEENASLWCTVHFMALGGTPEPPMQRLQKGERAQEPASNPAKEGFTFQEWMLEGVPYNFMAAVTKDIVLKAEWSANTGVTERTVTFMALGGKFADGSDVMVFTVQDGKSVSRPQDDPIKEGFTLQGWTLNGEAYDFTTAVTKDIVLKAQWVKKDPSVKEHTVTFMALGGKFADGSDVQAFTVKDGEAVLEPTAPKKEGFTLQGWTLEGVPYSFTAAVKNDIVLKAAWEANSGVTEHEVTFMALGGKFADGSDVQTFTVKDGEAVLEPTAPKKEGYILTGWTKDGSAEYIFTTPVTADLVLYAMWKKEDPSVKEHTVTFMALGGAFADGKDVQSFTVKAGEAVLEPMAPEKEGYTLQGWTLNGEAYDFSKAVTKDIVLKAQWEKRDPSMTEHKVTFMALGGAFADGSDVQSFTVKDGEMVLKPTAPVKEGYTLEGWTKDGNGEYDFDTSVREDIVLYAMWKKDAGVMVEHTVTFVANGGTFADGKERMEFKVADGKTVLKPTAPVKAGAFFSGWRTQGGEKYDFSQPVTTDLELEARWESSEHTVSFMALGGKPEPQTQRVVHDDKATRPQDPVKKGFTFQGWTLDGVPYGFTEAVTKDIVLKAQWKKEDPNMTEYTVTFMALGGKFADGSDVQSFTVKDGETVLEPTAPVKAGFILAGWTLDGAAYDFTVAVTKDIVLKAQWEKENPGVAERTVTFMALGGAFADGSDVQTFTVKAGETVLEPTAPVKEGYTLTGWTKDRSVKYDFTVAVTEDIVLYAMWEKKPEVTKEHTVTFMALGGAFADGTDVQSFTVKDGATVRKPQDPAKKGFTFQGWTLDGAPYGFTEAVTKDIVLKAKWEKVDPNMTEYTVTFMALGGTFADGSDVQSFTVKAGETVLVPTAPVKEGYTLKGWKKANGAEYSFGDRVNADLVLYAVWEKEQSVTVEHKVVFVATGGTFADGKNRMKFKVADGTVLTQPEKPTRADFTFRRWMLRGAAYDFAQPVKEDLVLEAQWIANPGVETFTVTFMANGGAPEPLVQIVKNGEKAQEPIDVKKEGFKLKGWTLDGAAYDFTTAVTANIVLKAQWEKEDPSMATHVVTYVANGGKFADGSERMEVEVAAGKLANRPTDPVKKGSALTGWTLDRTPYGFTEPVTKDIELVAQWESSEHTVSFMALGGEPEPQEQRVEHGGKATRPQDEPRKAGFTFRGWTLSGAKYDFDDAVTKDIALKAKWEKEPGVTERMVTFMALGGAFADGSDVLSFAVKDGETVRKPKDPVKKGFTFKGWMLDGATYGFNEAVRKDIVLKAQWEKEDPSMTEHRVTFMALGGAFADGSDVQSFAVKDGETVLEPTAPVKEGYTLKRWTKDGSTRYNFDDAVTADLVLYAMWDKKQSVMVEHTVVFVANGGTFADGKNRMAFEVADGTVLMQPEKPTRADFTFGGWMLRGAAYDFTRPVSENLVLEAQWVPNPDIVTFTVTFMAYGGTPEPLVQIVKNGEKAQEPIDVKKERFTLKGWTLDGAAYDFTTAVTANIVLKAQWEQDPGVTVHTVIYVANGGKFADGSDRMEVEVADGTLANRPTDPEKDGCALTRWTLGGAEYNFTEPVTEDIELVAQWEEQFFKVVFIANGGSPEPAIQRVKKGEKAQEPSAEEEPKMAGYVFKGWMLGEERYDFTKEVTKDIVLLAKWAEETTLVESRLLANVRVYPNPVARVLSVQAEAEVARYELTNASGVRVKMGAPSASELRLDVSQLPEGLYLLRLADTEGNWTICKVLVQR